MVLGVVILVSVAGVSVLRQGASAPNVQKAYRSARDNEINSDAAADAAIQKMRANNQFGKDGGTTCGDKNAWQALGSYSNAYVQCQPQAGSGSPTIPTSLWSYSLFAFNQLNVFGQTTVGNGRGVVNGNVGVDLPTSYQQRIGPVDSSSSYPGNTNPAEGAAQICSSGGLTVTGLLAAASIDSSNSGKSLNNSVTCALDDVFTNSQSSNQSWFNVGSCPNAKCSSWSTAYVPPAVPFTDVNNPFPWPGATMGDSGIPAPELGPCHSAKAPVVVNSGTQTLPVDASGTYYGSTVTVKNGATLQLQAGRYKLCGFYGGSNAAGFATLKTVTGTEVEIEGQMALDSTHVVHDPDQQDALFFIKAAGDQANLTWWPKAGQQALFIGTNSNTVYGTFVVPSGTINLGTSANLYGHFWGSYFKGGKDVNVNVGSAAPPSASNRTVKLAVCRTNTVPCPSGSVLLDALVSFVDAPSTGRQVKILSWVRNQ